LPLADIDRLLQEDASAGDLTTEALGLAGRRGRIRFAARGGYVVAGVETAADMLQRAGAEVTLCARSGDAVASGTQLLSGDGDAADLHLAWKTSQTLVEVLSGFATAARAIVAAAQSVNPDVQVACTRKVFPGGCALSHIAVKAGGAILHRASLSETVLVFREHLTLWPDASLDAVATRLRRNAPEKKLAIEADGIEEAKRALAAGCDVIQLEKFPIEAVAEVVAHARATGVHAIIAAAGRVNAANAAAQHDELGDRPCRQIWLLTW